MSTLLRGLASFLFFCGLSTGICAQSLSDEQAKLAKLERQNENLVALNADIEISLSDLNTQIEQLEAQQAPSAALQTAEAELAAAQATQEASPSSINQDKLEMAQFKHALALRKHNKGNPQLSRLKKEHDELTKAIKSNQQKINNNKTLIGSQINLVRTLRAEQANAQEAQRIKQEQQKNAAEQAQLRRAEQERRDALAEVERLRALLAEQQRQQAELEQQQLAAEEAQRAATPSITEAQPNADSDTTFESFVFLAGSANISAETARIAAAIKASPAGSKFSKFVSVKTYNNSTLISRETKRLNHIGGDIYQSERITIPVKDTEFVVGQNTWRVNLPALDAGVPAGQASTYVITLDLRNSELPFLTIYPN